MASTDLIHGAGPRIMSRSDMSLLPMTETSDPRLENFGLSLSKDKTRRLWSADGEPLGSWPYREGQRRFPEFAADQCRAGGWHAFEERRTAIACDPQNSELLRWQAESYTNARHLFPDRRLIATQDNGQVCFLRIYDGNRMIALDGTSTSPIQTTKASDQGK